MAQLQIHNRSDETHPNNRKSSASSIPAIRRPPHPRKASPKIVSRSCTSAGNCVLLLPYARFPTQSGHNTLGLFRVQCGVLGPAELRSFRGPRPVRRRSGQRQPNQRSRAARSPRPRPRCGNYSGADQTNANAGDRQRMVSHTSPAAALPSAWGAGRFQAEGPEIEVTYNWSAM